MYLYLVIHLLNILDVAYAYPSETWLTLYIDTRKKTREQLSLDIWNERPQY